MSLTSVGKRGLVAGLVTAKSRAHGHTEEQVRGSSRRDKSSVFFCLFEFIFEGHMLENCKRLICSPSLNKVYCIVLYCIVLYCIVLYCIVLYCNNTSCVVAKTNRFGFCVVDFFHLVTGTRQTNIAHEGTSTSSPATSGTNSNQFEILREVARRTF